MFSGEIIPTKLGTFGFRWEIKNFSKTNKNVGEALISPPFICGGSNNKWQLELYPKGETEEVNDYISLYLKNIDKRKITVYSKFSILKNKEKKAFENGSFTEADIFTEVKSKWGYDDFVKQSFILDKTNNILMDDKLKILCEIILESDLGDANDSNQCNEKQKREKCVCKFSDITFIVDGKEIYVHKNILASSSTVFDAMFKSDMKEKKQNKVVIEDIKFEVLMELFQYMYTKEVNRINEVASDLLIVADKYCIEGLKSKCEKVLCDNITSNNVLEYLKLADVFRAPKLKSQAIEFITSHLKDVVKKPEFKIFVESNSNIICEVFQIMAHNK